MSSKHPPVLTELETLERAHAGESLARYGDGELKLALGRDCISQKADPRLAAELQQVLHAKAPVLPCIPSPRNAKGESWARFATAGFLALYDAGLTYGSAFITRPDSAPWIDTPDYWTRVTDLWRGRDVVLVAGTERSLRESMLTEAASVTEVRDEVSHRDAYGRIDEIEERIGTPSGRVLLCLGPTATVLAARLARKGVHALDLGHIGMFMRHAGIYRYQAGDLVSPAYAAQLKALHGSRKWGADGAKHAAAVAEFAGALNAETILDYGCGEQALSQALAKADPPRRVTGYDPGIAGREALPKPAELVVCTDVLEHVEPARIDAVLDHIFRLTGKGAYLIAATRPAKAVLPDGRNAHLIVQSEDWWLQKIAAVGATAGGWRIDRAVQRPGRDITLWLRK
jgi:2-polyprenyl-3-methyl-5-hydroxy-6-metoxy-1,4-benzoquinol methylase